MLTAAIVALWCLGVALAAHGARVSTWAEVEVPTLVTRLNDAAYRAGAARAARAAARSEASTADRDDRDALARHDAPVPPGSPS